MKTSIVTLSQFVYYIDSVPDDTFFLYINKVKNIVNGESGQKYRKRLAEIQDPLFSKEKGGSVDFTELFKHAKMLKYLISI